MNESLFDASISILESFLEDNSDSLKEEKVLEAIDAVSKIFVINSVEELKKVISKFELVEKKVKTLDTADISILTSIAQKVSLKDFDKVDFNDPTSLKELLKKFRSAKRTFLNSKPLEIKQNARKELAKKGLEFTAENLAKEASISIEEADKYIKKIDLAEKARVDRLERKKA